MSKSEYFLKKESDKIVLKTTSFKAEKGSILHTDVFNQELAASFLAVACALAIIFFVAHTEWKIIHYIIALLIFIILFPIFRLYLFRDSYIVTTIDKKNGLVTINLNRPILSKTITKPLKSLKDIKITLKKLKVENIDGIAIVEKIALQHGTVGTDFGKEEEFYNLVLEFEDEAITIFTTHTKEKAENILKILKCQKEEI